MASSSPTPTASTMAREILSRIPAYPSFTARRADGDFAAQRCGARRAAVVALESGDVESHRESLARTLRWLDSLNA